MLELKRPVRFSIVLTVAYVKFCYTQGHYIPSGVDRGHKQWQVIPRGEGNNTAGALGTCGKSLACRVEIRVSIGDDTISSTV